MGGICQEPAGSSSLRSSSVNRGEMGVALHYLMASANSQLSTTFCVFFNLSIFQIMCRLSLSSIFFCAFLKVCFSFLRDVSCQSPRPLLLPGVKARMGGCGVWGGNERGWTGVTQSSIPACFCSRAAQQVPSPDYPHTMPGPRPHWLPLTPASSI